MDLKKRTVWLDIARGICIILMIICHACGWANGRWGYFNGITGTFFLVFFFVSAGITFNPKAEFVIYVKKQFKKCIIPYLIISVSYLLVLFYRHGIPGDGRLIKLVNAFFSLIWSLSNTFNIGPFTTVGVGPIWFLTVYFVSTCMFFLLYDKKYSGVIFCSLAIISSITQRFVTLPFTIQNMFIGCMFMWIGYRCKEVCNKYISILSNTRLIKLCLLGVCSIIFFMFCAGVSWKLSAFLGTAYLDLGSNNYSIVSLPASLAGIITLIIISLIIEKTKILDEVLSFCGRETFLILCLHSIDITMARNWGNKGLTFMFFTIMAYPFAIYLFRRFQKMTYDKRAN